MSLHALHNTRSKTFRKRPLEVGYTNARLNGYLRPNPIYGPAVHRLSGVQGDDRWEAFVHGRMCSLGILPLDSVDEYNRT